MKTQSMEVTWYGFPGEIIFRKYSDKKATVTIETDTIQFRNNFSNAEKIKRIEDFFNIDEMIDEHGNDLLVEIGQRV